MNYLTNLKNKKYLNVSYWGWPIFGGGEQFLFDCMKWACNVGMDCYWICFAMSDPKKPPAFEKFQVINSQYGTIIQIPGGFNVSNVKNWIKLINPDIINHQGRERLRIVKACNELGYPCMTGVCFWNECIQLDPHVFNKDILQNAKVHKKAPEFDKVIKYSTIVYSASYFVMDVIKEITGIKLKYNIFSSSNKDNCLLQDHEKYEQEYVTLINYHELKGGQILLECIRRLPHIPFLCVKTEFLSEKLDKAIEDEIDTRNALAETKEGVAKCKYVMREPMIKTILKQTKILLVASLVDETFCRTCNEALCNGIPIITTGKGNIGYMVGNNAIIKDQKDYDGWAKSIDKLYTNKKYYDIMSKKALEQYKLSSEEVAEKQFLEAVYDCMFKIDKDKNVMIFVPWCDQGLGIQGRIYVNILERIGYKTHIFGFKPYLATKENPRFQKNPREWEHPSVYYSENDRETVTDEELIRFVQHKKISKMILPEICYNRVFEITELLNKYGVKTYCIPNIEICRKNELERYKVFEKVMCNNHYCEELLNKNDVLNTCYISHVSIDKRIKFKKKKYKKGDKLKFLNLGGLNSIVRKQCYKVCLAFIDAHKINPNMEMTITIQGSQIPEEIKKFAMHPALNLVIKHLPYKEIITFYQKSHVSIQVSKHEGLGLGFYESLMTGTPVITLNTPLHNEVIIDGENGWWIDCEYEDMKDNPESLLQSAIFETKDLTNKMLKIADDYENTLRIIKNTKRNHDDRFNLDKICGYFYEAMQ